MLVVVWAVMCRRAGGQVVIVAGCGVGGWWCFWGMGLVDGGVEAGGGFWTGCDCVVGGGCWACGSSACGLGVVMRGSDGS